MSFMGYFESRRVTKWIIALSALMLFSPTSSIFSGWADFPIAGVELLTVKNLLALGLAWVVYMMYNMRV